MITFELVTLDGVKFEQDCWEVVLPTEQGQIAIFPNHAPLVSVASPGVVSVRRNERDKDDAMDHFAIDGGVIEVGDKRVRLLADEAQSADDLDELEVKAALERAKELQKSARDKVSLADATSLIERRVAQLKVAEIKRRKRR